MTVPHRQRSRDISANRSAGSCLMQGLSSSCCGMLFNSRGFKGAASHKGQELEQSLVKASQGGKIPIVMDTSPCLAQMKGALTDPCLK